MTSLSAASVQCPIARTPGDLAAFVPVGVERLLDCTSNDVHRWAALRDRGVRHITAIGAPDDKPVPGADEYLCGALTTHAQQGGTLEGKTFTAIISDGDLPQYRNPEGYLSALRNLLVPGGLLVLATPNMQYHRVVRALAEAGWAYEDSGPWARQSLRFFTAIELKRLVAAHGFEPLRTSSLRADNPEEFPLDATGHVRSGRVILGPLSPSEHQSFLAADIVCLAMRPAW